MYSGVKRPSDTPGQRPFLASSDFLAETHFRASCALRARTVRAALPGSVYALAAQSSSACQPPDATAPTSGAAIRRIEVTERRRQQSPEHRMPNLRYGTAASKKGRLVTARDAVVVPPAKDAENNVALAVKSSMVDALARSGNRVLERVATAIKKAGHHKNEAAYVRDELLKARSECHKLGITGT